MKENVLRKKSFAFAVRVVKLNRFLCEEKKEFVLAKQILRSGTSIGANVSEAIYAQSIPDFYAKLCIAKKETAETIYWLELLKNVEAIDDRLCESFRQDCEELLRILIAICKNTEKKKTKNLTP